MGIFDPQVDANVSPTQVVQAGPSVGQTLGNLLGGAIDAYGAGMKVAAASAPTAGQLKDVKTNAQMVGFSDSLLKVEALRRDGRNAEADRAEQVVMLNATRDGIDLSSGEFKATYRAATGRDPKYMGVSDEERLAEEIMATPGYQNALIGSYASGEDMSFEERKNFAMAQVAKEQGHSMVMTNQKIGWQQGKQEAFIGAIDTFEQTTLGALNIAATEGKIIPMGTLDQLEVSWTQQKSALASARPAGISDAEWKPVQDKITRVDESLKVLRKVGSAENIEAKLAQNFAAAVQAMDAPVSEKMMLLQLVKDPNMLKEYDVISNTRVKEMLEATTVTEFDMGDFGVRSDPQLNNETNNNGDVELWPASVKKDIEGQEPGVLLKTAKDGALALKMGGSENLAADPSKAKAFTKVASKAFAAVATIPDSGDFISSRGINEVFDGTLIAGIQEVAKNNPAAARTLYSQGEYALNVQDAAATQAFSNLVSRSPGFAYEDGKITMSPEAMDDLGFDKGVQKGLQDAADQYYGGDLAAMFTDRGRLIDPRNQDTKFSREIMRGGQVAGILGGINKLNDMAATVKTIRQKRNAFRAGAQALAPEGTASNESGEVVAAAILGTTDATKVRGFDKVSGDKPFLTAVNKVGNQLGVSPTDLLAVMSFETVGSFDAGIQNPNSTATGLIQFLESTAKGLGTSTTALSKMSRVEQMEYVQKYLAPFKGKMKNLGDIYMAVHWPAGVGKDDAYVMYKTGSDEYEANKNLDLNGDGTVTRGETLVRLQSVISGSTTAGPSIGEAPAQPASPEATTAGEAVRLATVQADAGQIARNSRADQVGDELRSTDTPEQPVVPAAGEPSKSVSRELDKQAIAKLVDEKLTPKQKRQIRAAGYRPEETEFFKDQEEAEAALAAGEVEPGTLYVTETGNVWLLE